MSYRSYNEDEEFQEDPDFVAEFAARERVGSSRPTFIDIKIDVEKGRRGRLSLKSELSEDQLFLYDLQKVYYRYTDDISIGLDDIEIIKSLVLRISHIGCKNPTAFLLAYSCLNTRNKEIKIDNLNRLKTVLKNVEGIELEDIIRYTRLIISFL